jgi:predicted RNase H-like HicB family nuclease
MLTDYLTAAMERAHYELIEDDEPFYGSVPGIEGLWATGATLEDCRRNLASALEDWLLFSIHRGSTLPEIGGIRIEIPRPAA